MRHPSQLNGKNYGVRHVLCRGTPWPLKLSIPVTDFGVLTFFVDLGLYPSREQWYHGLNELEFNS